MGIYVHRLLSKFNRLQLASVARYLWDNVGLVFYATDLIANYSTPMMPRAATLDRRWNEAANSLFDDWSGRADFTGRFDFWDLQRLSSFYLDTDGEVFARPSLVRGLRGLWQPHFWTCKTGLIGLTFARESVRGRPWS